MHFINTIAIGIACGDEPAGHRVAVAGAPSFEPRGGVALPLLDAMACSFRSKV